MSNRKLVIALAAVSFVTVAVVAAVLIMRGKTQQSESSTEENEPKLDVSERIEKLREALSSLTQEIDQV